VKRPGDALFGALLFVLALAPRLYLALLWSSEPVWDGQYYDFGARRIAQGAGYSDDLPVAGHLVWHPWCHYPVGYSAFLAIFYRVFGDGHAIAAVANALVGAALAVVTWLLARHALSPGRARAAGVIVALHPGLVLYAALVMSEPLAALLTLTAFWVAVASPPRRGLVLGALLLGVGALVRPQALLCAPFLALVAARGRARLVSAAVACAVALVPVLPWTARNCRVMDGCALVSTNAGWNLAIGAFPRATGRFETLHASDGCRDVTGQVQQDRCWLDYGVGQIRAHPWHWLALVPAKLGFTFDTSPSPWSTCTRHDPRPGRRASASEGAGRPRSRTGCSWRAPRSAASRSPDRAPRARRPCREPSWPSSAPWSRSRSRRTRPCSGRWPSSWRSCHGSRCPDAPRRRPRSSCRWCCSARRS
jgi:hypothetical protein